MAETLINDKAFEEEMASRLSTKLDLGWATKEEMDSVKQMCEANNLEIEKEGGEEADGFAFKKADSKDKLIQVWVKAYKERVLHGTGFLVHDK